MNDRNAGIPPDPVWLEALFGLSSAEQQYLHLTKENLADEQGMSALLDFAMQLARRDPGKARALTQICLDVARQAGPARLIPRATYALAQTHAINGDFATALSLIKAAQEEYRAIGEELEMLRTNLGMMHVLNELGQHALALEAGEAILNAVEQIEDPAAPAKQMAALAHLNQGVCYETMGQYGQALVAYDAAENLFSELGAEDRLADVCNNRGIVLVHLGRVSEALSAFEKAARIAAGAGLTLLRAQIQSNIGEAHLVLGNYTSSLKAYAQARDIFSGLEAGANQSILLRKTADAYLALNLYPEALSQYREAIRQIEQSGMADHHARALWGMGAALAAEAQYESARKVLEEAAALFRSAGNTPMLCSVLLEQAALQNARGDRDAALETAAEALSLVEEKDWPVERFYACLRMSDLHLPDTTASERYLRQAGQIAQSLNLPVIRYRLDSRMGHLRRLQNRDSEARAFLERSVAEIEKLRGDLAHEASRTSFLQDKTAVYEDLILLYLRQGDTEAAFSTAERAKSRTLVDLLTGVIDPRGSPAADSDLDYRIRALQAELSALYNRLLRPAEGETETTRTEVQNRSVALEREISRLQLQILDRGARSGQLDAVTSTADIQAGLAEGLVLLAYHIVGDEILAFILHREGLAVLRNLGNPSLVQDLVQRLYIQWDRFRAGEDFIERHAAMLEKSARRILAALYEELFADVESQLKKFGFSEESGPLRLVIVPHGVLHQVPFNALHDGDYYILEKYEISYALSATVFAISQGERRHPAKLDASKRALVVGVADDSIPAVDSEARNLASELSEIGIQTDLLIGEGAQLQAFQGLAPGCDLLHLACHGLFRSDNPMFSALKLSDGWLTAVNILHLPLDGALATLSACESGRNRVLLGDEAIGLPRAFLGAGAASVNVSLWIVPDETTARLMASWYRGMKEGSEPVAALREAQLALKAEKPHPYYWAPFVLIGQR